MAVDARKRLVISIDLELAACAGSLEHQRQLDAIAARLTELLAAHRLPATIAVSDPIYSAATETINASPLGHEIAILGDVSWVGRGAGRERFGRELARRFHSARAAGIPVTSLALRGVDLSENFDLLTRENITAIRLDASSGKGVDRPQFLRFGMWQVPVTLSIPVASQWFQSPLAITRRAVKRALEAYGVAHLTLDAGELVDNPASKLGEIERVLAWVDSLQSAHAVEVLTLGHLAQVLDRPAETAPRSILRAA